MEPAKKESLNEAYATDLVILLFHINLQMLASLKREWKV